MTGDPFLVRVEHIVLPPAEVDGATIWLPVSDASAGWLPWSGDHGESWPSRTARLCADEPVKMQQLHQLMQHGAWPGTPARLGWDGLVWDGLLMSRFVLAVEVP